MFAGGAAQARQAWSDAGREGKPRLVSLAYVSLGEDAAAHAQSYLGDYYRFLGDITQMIVDSALITPSAVSDAIAAFTEVGCDELILFPCNPDISQVGLIAEAAGL